MSPAHPSWEFSGTAYRWPANPRVFLVSIGESISDEIADLVGENTGGFGAVPVEATIGPLTWHTSLFPDTGAGAYVLPLKKQVRTANDLADGSLVRGRVALRAHRAAD